MVCQRGDLTGLVIWFATGGPQVTLSVDDVFGPRLGPPPAGYKLLTPRELERLDGDPTLNDREGNLVHAIESKVRADKVLSVLFATLVTGYIGFSLDAGYTWLRKKKQPTSQAKS